MAAEGDAIRVAKALRHPLRARVFYEYSQTPCSPSRVARRLGEPVNLVAYHSKVLERLGCIRPVTAGAAGSRVTRYEAVVPPVIEDEDWGQVPVKLRRAYIRSILSMMVEDAMRSAIHGGFDRATVHVSRIPLYLDDEGTQALAMVLRELLDDVAAIERGAAARAGERVARELIVLSFDDVSPIVPV